MRADELIRRYSMDDHIENGKFIECHYENKNGGRAASGSIYYYVAPGERTEFHKIDCDEYWIYIAGETLELWVIDLEGNLEVKHCGISDGAEPMVRFAAGELFASRMPEDAADGCFVSCITVPRFTYDGFEMREKDTMLQQYPDTIAFWN